MSLPNTAQLPALEISSSEGRKSLLLTSYFKLSPYSIKDEFYYENTLSLPYTDLKRINIISEKPFTAVVKNQSIT